MGWRVDLEVKYAVLCKGCNRKILDPDKKKNQVYSKGTCPLCHFNPKDKKKK